MPYQILKTPPHENKTKNMMYQRSKVKEKLDDEFENEKCICFGVFEGCAPIFCCALVARTILFLNGKGPEGRLQVGFDASCKVQFSF